MFNNKAFTLMELLVVIAIIATISALVLPSFRPPNENGQANLIELRNFIEKQRNIVIKSGEPKRLEIPLNDGELRAYKIFQTEEEKTKDPIPTAEFTTPISGYNLTIANAVGENNIDGEVIISPDGSINPFVLKKQLEHNKYLTLTYSGTAAVGEIKVNNEQ